MVRGSVAAANGKNRLSELPGRFQNVPGTFTELVRTLDMVKILNVPRVLLLPILQVNRFHVA